MSFWQAAALIFATISASTIALWMFMGYRYEQRKRDAAEWRRLHAKERQHGHRRN